MRKRWHICLFIPGVGEEFPAKNPDPNRLGDRQRIGREIGRFLRNVDLLAFFRGNLLAPDSAHPGE